MSKWSIIQGSHFKKIVGHGSLYFIASVVTKGIYVILLPIYTHWLKPSEYAIFSNLFAVAALAGVFTSLYLDNAYARFYFDAENDAVKLRQIFSTIFLFMLGWGLVACVTIFFIIRAPIVRTYDVPVVPYVLLVCTIPLLKQFNILASVNYRVQHKSVYVTGASYLWCGASTTVSLVLLLVFGLKAQALLWGIVAGEVASLLFYYVRLVGDGLIGGVFSPRLLKEVLFYSLGLLPLTAASWLSGYSDRLLITWFGELADSGVYSVAFDVGRIINVMVLSIFMVYGPMIFAMLKEGREKNIWRIEVFQSFYFHLLLGCAFFLSLFTPELFGFLVDEKYHVGTSLVPIIAFAFVFAGVRKLYATPIYYHKLTLLISVGGIMQALVNFGINYMLIPFYGGKAAAWSKLVCMMMVALYFYALCRKYEPIRIDKSALGISVSILGGCLALFLLAAYVLCLSFWPLLAIKILILGFAIVCTWLSRFGKAMHLIIDFVRNRSKKEAKLEVEEVLPMNQREKEF